jgi:hypothetical protein
MVLSRGWRERLENGELVLNGCRATILQNEKGSGDGWW